jgi:hypothetical protein
MTRKKECYSLFLNSLKYNYYTNADDGLSETQKQEVLRRQHLYETGEMKAEPWNEVKKRFNCLN